MINWLENFSFSDFMVASSALVAAIAAYFNLNNKLDQMSSKIEELEETQSEIRSAMKESEISQKRDSMDMASRMNDKILAVEDRQRVFDLFMARFEEKMNYLSEQMRQLTTVLEKKNDK